jgi:methylphosphotriester-DNA--protein-cysteine methyltransferase
VRFVGSDTTNVFCNPTCRNARRIRDEHRIAFSSENAARAAGYRPCRHCRPAA